MKNGREEREGIVGNYRDPWEGKNNRDCSNECLKVEEEQEVQYAQTNYKLAAVG